MLGTGLRQQTLHKIYEVYQEWVDTQKFACTEGCATCCTRNVMVTTLEGELIRDKIGETLLLEWIELRLADGDSDIECSSTMNEWARACITNDDSWLEDAGAETHTPCRLLTEEQTCPIYEVRPFSCRCFASLESCLDGGTAIQTPDLIAVNTAVMQVIEHLDQGRIYGPLEKVARFISLRKKNVNPEAGISTPLQSGENVVIRGLRRSQPLPGFVSEKESREAVRTFLQRLFKERIDGTSLHDILNNG